MSTPLTAQTDPWLSSSDFTPPPAGKMPKNGHKREESYEGHLGFKSAVSPLFSLSEEEERKKKTLIKLRGTQSYCLAKRLKKRKKEKASAKVMEHPKKSKLVKGRCLQANHQQQKAERC